MRPYEVEIFDRQFNFRVNALADLITWQEDVLTVAKNSFYVPKDKINVRDEALSGTPGDGTVCCSDYVRIYNPNNDITYTGIVTEINDAENLYEIVYCSLYKLLDHELLVLADEIKHTYIESYIYKLAKQEFRDNQDTFQNIEGIYFYPVIPHTSGTFEYNDTKDIYVTINLLDDLIYPAFQNYLLLTTLTLDIENKRVTFRIEKKYGGSTDIETRLSNIIDANFTLRNTTDEVNKATLYDFSNYTLTPYTFYLHPSDYSYDQINNSDRLFPVVNRTEIFDGDQLTEEAYLRTANEYIIALEKYLTVDYTLSDVEISELSTSMTHLWDYIKTIDQTGDYDDIFDALHSQLRASWSVMQEIDYQYIENGSYEDLIEEGTGYYIFGYDISESTLTWEDYAAKQTVSGYSGDINYPAYPSEDYQHITTTGTIHYNTNTHVSFKRTHVKYDMYIILNGWGNVPTHYTFDVTVYTPVTSGMANTAINNYKNSEQFQIDFAAYKAVNFQAVIDGYAKQIFETSQYKNLIELTVKEDDTMIKPLTWHPGDGAKIRHNGKIYPSILTGREIGNGLVKLIFGMVRLELTQILNMKGV